MSFFQSLALLLDPCFVFIPHVREFFSRERPLLVSRASQRINHFKTILGYDVPLVFSHVPIQERVAMVALWVDVALDEQHRHATRGNEVAGVHLFPVIPLAAGNALTNALVIG